MRSLQLQTPYMTGPDVSDWQTFLKSRGLFQTTVDGAFGPKSDQATRAYQTSAGLMVDGLVAATAVAKAESDGYVSTTGSNVAGMDARVDCSAFADNICGEGMKFVARYYSDTIAKTLAPAEAEKLSNCGVGTVAVFEDSNNAVSLFSAATGAKHASKALELAAAIGQPAGSGIYFAVDFEPAPADVEGPICDYFKAIHDILAAASVPYVVGVYGSGLTCRLIRDAGLARFTWLTCSIGFQEYAAFRPQADIVQLAPQRPLFDGRLTIDDDIAQSAEFGAFSVGQALTAIPT